MAALAAAALSVGETVAPVALAAATFSAGEMSIPVALRPARVPLRSPSPMSLRLSPVPLICNVPLLENGRRPFQLGTASHKETFRVWTDEGGLGY